MRQAALPMSAATDTVIAPLDVIAWRYEELVRVGYPLLAALDLAGRSDVDLHEARELLERGATVAQAVEILR